MSSGKSIQLVQPGESKVISVAWKVLFALYSQSLPPTFSPWQALICFCLHLTFIQSSVWINSEAQMGPFAPGVFHLAQCTWDLLLLLVHLSSLFFAHLFWLALETCLASPPCGMNENSPIWDWGSTSQGHLCRSGSRWRIPLWSRDPGCQLITSGCPLGRVPLT